jgi:hypothetical protein
MATFRLGNSGRGHRGRAAVQRTILGIPELDARLEGLEIAVANRVARSALSKGVRIAVKKIKAQVPSAQKDIRKAIGGTVKRQKRGRNKGWTEAKAGAAVGQSKSKQASAAASAKDSRGNKGGVGISAANIHWYIQGTKERFRKKVNPGQRSGKMPANPIVQKAMATGKGPVLAAIKEGVTDGIERERLKLVRRYMVKWHGQ